MFYLGEDFMSFFAFLLFAYGILCITLAIIQIRYYYKNKLDKKFINLEKYTKSMVSLFLITSILSILLGLVIIFEILSMTIGCACFSLILSVYMINLRSINKKYGIHQKVN